MFFKALNILKMVFFRNGGLKCFKFANIENFTQSTDDNFSDLSLL